MRRHRGQHDGRDRSPRSEQEAVLTVGMLGCGVVGSAVAEQLLRRRDELSRRVGCEVRLTRVAVRHLDKPRPAGVDGRLLTRDPLDLAADERIDLVVEVMGGIDVAGRAIATALDAGKHVVTANKQLVARHGPALERRAAARHVALHCEAAVAGAAPVVRMLRHSLAGDRLHAFCGVLNGTTNFVLTQMSVHGWTLDRAVEQAQRLGLAEADPTEDLSGADAAAKAVILARLAFGEPLSLSEVDCTGLDGDVEALVASARASGATVKLVVSARRDPGGVHVVVRPRMLDLDHPLARVTGAENALLVEGEASGRIVVTGTGAGGDPTASAVLGDVVCALRQTAKDRQAPTAPSGRRAWFGRQDRAALPAAGRYAVRPVETELRCRCQVNGLSPIDAAAATNPEEQAAHLPIARRPVRRSSVPMHPAAGGVADEDADARPYPSAG